MSSFEVHPDEVAAEIVDTVLHVEKLRNGLVQDWVVKSKAHQLAPWVGLLKEKTHRTKAKMLFWTWLRLDDMALSCREERLRVMLQCLKSSQNSRRQQPPLSPKGEAGIIHQYTTRKKTHDTPLKEAGMAQSSSSSSKMIPGEDNHPTVLAPPAFLVADNSSGSYEQLQSPSSIVGEDSTNNRRNPQQEDEEDGDEGEEAALDQMAASAEAVAREEITPLVELLTVNLSATTSPETPATMQLRGTLAELVAMLPTRVTSTFFNLLLSSFYAVLLGSDAVEKRLSCSVGGREGAENAGGTKSESIFPLSHSSASGSFASSMNSSMAASSELLGTTIVTLGTTGGSTAMSSPTTSSTRVEGGGGASPEEYGDEPVEEDAAGIAAVKRMVRRHTIDAKEMEQQVIAQAKGSKGTGVLILPGKAASHYGMAEQYQEQLLAVPSSSSLSGARRRSSATMLLSSSKNSSRRGSSMAGSNNNNTRPAPSPQPMSLTPASELPTPFRSVSIATNSTPKSALSGGTPSSPENRRKTVVAFAEGHEGGEDTTSSRVGSSSPTSPTSRNSLLVSPTNSTKGSSPKKRNNSQRTSSTGEGFASGGGDGFDRTPPVEIYQKIATLDWMEEISSDGRAYEQYSSSAGQAITTMLLNVWSELTLGCWESERPYYANLIQFFTTSAPIPTRRTPHSPSSPAGPPQPGSAAWKKDVQRLELSFELVVKLFRELVKGIHSFRTKAEKSGGPGGITAVLSPTTHLRQLLQRSNSTKSNSGPSKKKQSLSQMSQSTHSAPDEGEGNERGNAGDGEGDDAFDGEDSAEAVDGDQHYARNFQALTGPNFAGAEAREALTNLFHPSYKIRIGTGPQVCIPEVPSPAIARFVRAGTHRSAVTIYKKHHLRMGVNHDIQRGVEAQKRREVLERLGHRVPCPSVGLDQRDTVLTCNVPLASSMLSPLLSREVTSDTLASMLGPVSKPTKSMSSAIADAPVSATQFAKTSAESKALRRWEAKKERKPTWKLREEAISREEAARTKQAQALAREQEAQRQREEYDITAMHASSQHGSSHDGNGSGLRSSTSLSRASKPGDEAYRNHQRPNFFDQVINPTSMQRPVAGTPLPSAKSLLLYVKEEPMGLERVVKYRAQEQLRQEELYDETHSQVHDLQHYRSSGSQARHPTHQMVEEDDMQKPPSESVRRHPVLRDLYTSQHDGVNQLIGRSRVRSAERQRRQVPETSSTIRALKGRELLIESVACTRPKSSLETVRAREIATIGAPIQNRSVALQNYHKFKLVEARLGVQSDLSVYEEATRTMQDERTRKKTKSMVDALYSSVRLSKNAQRLEEVAARKKRRFMNSLPVETRVHYM